MKDCIKYVIILFILSLFLSKMVEDKEDNIEGLVNLLDIKIKDVLTNPALAGSIGDTYSPEFLKGSCKRKKQIYNNYKIYDPGEYEKNLFDIETRIFDENLKYKLKNFKPVEYAPYDVILPQEFQKDNKVQDPTTRKRYFINSNEIDNGSDNIFGVPDANYSRNDCKGEWGSWNESQCTDSKNRCALKFRSYTVTKKKGAGGRDCTHNDIKVNDGDIDYDYCYGDNNMDRCGSTTNLCQCDLDNYSAKDCDSETSQLDCRCPQLGYIKKDGKCISQDDNQLNDILLRLSLYNVTHHRN